MVVERLTHPLPDSPGVCPMSGIGELDRNARGFELLDESLLVGLWSGPQRDDLRCKPFFPDAHGKFDQALFRASDVKLGDDKRNRNQVAGQVPSSRSKAALG